MATKREDDMTTQSLSAAIEAGIAYDSAITATDGDVVHYRGMAKGGWVRTDEGEINPRSDKWEGALVTVPAAPDGNKDDSSLTIEQLRRHGAIGDLRLHMADEDIVDAVAAGALSEGAAMNQDF